MGNVYKDRYGIPGPEVKNLARRYYQYPHDSGWRKMDDFLLWCSQNGYEKGLMLRKHDQDKPHGPDNSFFEAVDHIKQENRRRKNERRELTSPFCAGCEVGCTNIAVGCNVWRSRFVKNWDENIHVDLKPPEPPKPEARECWQYEHPDLVREGIVFESNQHI